MSIKNCCLQRTIWHEDMILQDINLGQPWVLMDQLFFWKYLKLESVTLHGISIILGIINLFPENIGIIWFLKMRLKYSILLLFFFFFFFFFFYYFFFFFLFFFFFFFYKISSITMSTNTEQKNFSVLEYETGFLRI